MTSEAEQVYEYLRTHEHASRTDIKILLRLRSDRTARRYVAEVARSYPVISTSDGNGYRLATTESELLHQRAENIKRAFEILRRNAPINRALSEGNTWLYEN